MPHITFPLADLRALARAPDLDLDRLDALAPLVKGELKRRHSSEAEVKVELQDTNRPDTWCVEGLARQLRTRAAGGAAPYPCFEAPPAGAIEVDASVQGVRPYVAGFLASGWAVDEAGLQAFIAVQETLSTHYGRRRKAVAIGIYDGARLALPVRYEAVGLDDAARGFVPLRPAGDPAQVKDGAGRPIPAGRWAERWTPRQVLEDHPTGREHRAALGDAQVAPLLTDAAGEVLSFPPILNSDGLGRVVPGMSTLFVEVTGPGLDMVLLAANILAVNLADRGAEIRPLVTRYPFDTPRGREVRCPHPLADRRAVTLRLGEVRRLLGEPDLAPDELTRWLRAFGVDVAPAQEPSAGASEGPAFVVTAPPWRLDYLHEVDAIEDFAVARGYEALTPLMPEDFTVGRLDPRTAFADLARERMLGLGFEEAIGNVLTSPEEVRHRMRLDEATTPPGARGLGAAGDLHGGPLVAIDNVMNRNYAVVRDWLVPTLLEVERRSTGAVYPHRVFEAGEVAVWDAAAEHRARSTARLAAVVAHERAGFSELHGALDALLGSWGLAFEGPGAAPPGPRARGRYALEQTAHPSFIEGRATRVRARLGADGPEVALGVLGEVHPEVLERWGVVFPVAAFELDLEALRALVGA